jgi:hypothetical protein
MTRPNHPLDTEPEMRAQQLAAQLSAILTARGAAGASVAELTRALRAAGYTGHQLGVIVGLDWAVRHDRTVVAGPGDRFYDPQFLPGALS